MLDYVPKYVAVDLPRLAEAPFCGIFIGFRREVAIDVAIEVDGRS